MVNTVISKNHISLTSAQEVAAICAPLFNHFNLQLFVYNRSYCGLSTGGFALFSHPGWAEFFFTHDYHHRLTFTNMETVESINGYRFILTSLFPENKMLQNLREYYNIDHGIIVFKQYNQYYEWCTFAANRQDNQVLHFYLNQPEQLINFIAYFKIKAKHLLKKATQQRMMLPEVEDQQRIYLHDEVQNILSQNNHADFVRQMKLKHYSIEVGRGEYQFTKREMDCLYYLRQGHSAKTAARAMGISPRTVEYYLLAIRHKLDCVNKHQILTILGDNINFYQPN